MRRVVLVLGVSVSLALLAGCKPTPKKVCAHLAELGAPEGGADCLADMSTTQTALGTYWHDVGACFLASRAMGELATCYEVIDTITLQNACRGIVERAPTAYEGSLASCLRDLRVLKRNDDAARWATRHSCLQSAESADSVERCRR